jgi:tetratricopeptide (TPR) repeat protein
VQFGDAPEVIVARPDSDIEPLIQETAERIYRRAEPYRYANFLRRTGRTAEALPQLEELALSGDAEDRKWALPDWGVLVAQTAREGDRRNAQKFGVEKFREAIAIDPNFAEGWRDILVVERFLGHDEESLAAARQADALQLQASSEEYEPKRREADLHSVRSDVGALTGDYRRAVAEQILAAERDRDLFGPEVIIFDDLHLAEALIGDHDLAGAGRTVAELDSSSALYATLPTASQTRIKYVFGILYQDIAFARGQWNAASTNGVALMNAPAPTNLAVPLDQARWKSAVAAAYAGDFADAERLTADTPSDCDACLSARGNIAAAEKQWTRSAYWFARAAEHAPSLPFANFDWGRMLLSKGDLDDAIAMFALANRKSPHFADPLEMWGEALIRKNRSDLALAKFAEADKYAPNWGRLHLKWGEALIWTGKPAEAKKQFAIAASLDLSAPDQSQLARIRNSHG